MLTVNGTQVLMYGTVGADWWGDGFTAVEVVNALAALRGKAIDVHINSGGGYVNEGIAIYNALRAHDEPVTIYVDSIAASIASVIAMAGASTIMKMGATMMIHDPWVMTIGDATEHARALAHLEVDGESIAKIYMAKTKREHDDIRAEMKAETWLTADQAVELGFADSAEDASGDTIDAIAFDYRVYAKAPEQLRTLAATNGWSLSGIKPKAAAAAKPPKEQNMSGLKPNDPTNTDPAAAANQAAAEAAANAATKRATDIMKACNDAGEPGMAMALISEGLTLEQAQARVSGAAAIREAVTLAAKQSPHIDAKLADSYIASGASIDKVRADLFTKIADAQSAAPTTSQFSPKPQNSDSADVLKKIVAKQNARHPGTRNGRGVVAR